MSSAEAEATDTADAPNEGDGARQALVDLLSRELGDGVVSSHIDAGVDAWVRVETDAWEAAGRACRDTLGMRYFCFLSIIDWKPSPFGRSMDSDVDLLLEGATAKDAEEMSHGVTGGATRFQVFARLYSIEDKIGLTLKADIPDATESIASWAPLFGGANWHEREAYEMYGITFVGHPGLRKLYLPGDFEGYPLRKDFPLLARIAKPWPGIVDVEGMPGVADEEGGDA